MYTSIDPRSRGGSGMRVHEPARGDHRARQLILAKRADDTIVKFDRYLDRLLLKHNTRRVLERS